jgi:hypothetical protein
VVRGATMPVMLIRAKPHDKNQSAARLEASAA